jgi:hypothetical protein
VNQSFGHFCADPVQGVSRHLDGSPFHVGPQMHTSVTLNGDATARHAAADPFHLAGIAPDF